VTFTHGVEFYTAFFGTRHTQDTDRLIVQELAKRMRVAREIGTYKKEHDITVLQTGRYNEILEKRGAQGEQCGMSAEFVKVIFEAIHEESVRQQMEIINK
jgi:chorismate mutase